MTDKEKLIKTLKQVKYRGVSVDQYYLSDVAEYLLADGWIKPPCNIEDTVYIIDFSDGYAEMTIKEAVIVEITYLNSKRGMVYYITCKDGAGMSWCWNKDAFSTKEEAEEKLKELQNG